MHPIYKEGEDKEQKYENSYVIYVIFGTPRSITLNVLSLCKT